jgi:hypothetical protein
MVRAGDLGSQLDSQPEWLDTAVTLRSRRQRAHSVPNVHLHGLTWVRLCQPIIIAYKYSFLGGKHCRYIRKVLEAQRAASAVPALAWRQFSLLGSLKAF